MKLEVGFAYLIYISVDILLTFDISIWGPMCLLIYRLSGWSTLVIMPT